MSSKNADWRRKYGLEPEEYAAMLAHQDGRCAVCRRKPRAKDPSLAVDHDHRTGLIRGLLCMRCNHLLYGYFGEDPTFYENAAEYLVAPPALQVLGRRNVPDAPPVD